MREEVIRRLSRRPIPVSPKRPATSQLSGEWPSPYTGKGLDFRSHRPFQLGDDLRTVHMGTSVRTGETMVVERIARRDINLIVVLDCTPSMAIRKKADMLLATALMLLHSGVSLEMRTGAALLTNSGYRRLGSGSGMRHAMRLFDQIEQIHKVMQSGQPFSTDLPPIDAFRLAPIGSVMLYLSDFLDPRGYPLDLSSLSLESRRYDFIPVVIQDEFEYSFPALPGDTLLEWAGPETGTRLPLWIGTRDSAQIRTLHEQRFGSLQKSFASQGLHAIHIDQPSLDSVQQTLMRYFVLR
jgi:uncharacterized protein (DUF58 family)